MLGIISKKIIQFITGTNFCNLSLLTQLKKSLSLPQVKHPQLVCIASILRLHNKFPITGNINADHRSFEFQVAYAQKEFERLSKAPYMEWTKEIIRKKQCINQSKIYNILVDSEDISHQSEKCLIERSLRWTSSLSPREFSLKFCDELLNLRGKITDKLRFYIFSLFCNGWPTSRRTRFISDNVTEKCPFCGKYEDSIMHFFGRSPCSVIADSLTTLFPDEPDLSHDSIFLIKGKNKIDRCIFINAICRYHKILVFSKQASYTRGEHIGHIISWFHRLKTANSPTDSLKNKPTKLKQLAKMEHFNHPIIYYKEDYWEVSKKGDSDFTPTHPKGETVIKPRHEVLEIVANNSLPPIHVYTDGSFKRGHSAGWGFLVLGLGSFPILCGGQVCLDCNHKNFIGASGHNNNAGEISAIGHFFRNIRMDPRRPILIRPDSLYAIQVLTGIYPAKKNKSLIHTSRNFIRPFFTNRIATFKHVYSHSNHKWNDGADIAADLGSLTDYSDVNFHYSKGKYRTM